MFGARRVRYAKKAVPDKMIGSYRFQTSLYRQNGETPYFMLARLRQATHVSNETPQSKEEHVKQQIQPMADFPALLEHPECEESNETRRVDGYSEIGLKVRCVQSEICAESVRRGMKTLPMSGRKP